jgi:ketosteroid isomerase-like protein
MSSLRRWWLAGAALAVVLAVPAEVAAESRSPEQQAVVEVVTAAYVDGIHNYRDPAAIRQGFHPDFEMLILRDDKLEKLPIARWIATIEERNAKEPPPARDTPRTTTASFPLVEVTGTAAVCKVELVREGKLVFTDYLSLYRFADGWKIVGKSFYRHP